MTFCFRSLYIRANAYRPTGNTQVYTLFHYTVLYLLTNDCIKMITKLVFLLALVLGFFFLGQAQGFRQPKCRGKDTKLTPDELKVMGDCLKNYSSSSKGFTDIPKDSMGCVGKCILTKQGLIDPKGKPMKGNVMKMLNATFEPDIAKEADERIGKCIDEKSSGIDMNEKACQTYWPLVECVAGAFVQVCATNATGSAV